MTYKRIVMQEIEENKYLMELIERKEPNNKRNILESEIVKGSWTAKETIDKYIKNYSLDDNVIIAVNELNYPYEQCTVKEWINDNK